MGFYPHIRTVTFKIIMLRAKVDKKYTRKEQVKKKTSPSKRQTSFIPSPREEAAMASIFLLSSLPITFRESDTTSRSVILVGYHLRANANYSSPLILIASR